MLRVCRLHVSTFKFQVACFKLHVVVKRYPVVCCLLLLRRMHVSTSMLHVAKCTLHVSGCRFQVSGCRLQVASCRLQVVGFKQRLHVDEIPHYQNDGDCFGCNR